MSKVKWRQRNRKKVDKVVLTREVMERYGSEKCLAKLNWRDFLAKKQGSK